MDDKDDRGYTRAPEFQDLLRVCRSLNEQGARYILIGGFAVILHGYTRGTKDIDFLVESSNENIRLVKRGLAVLADKASELIEEDEVRRYQVVRIADEVVVDLLDRACGINYDDAKGDIDTVTIDGVEIPIASKKMLIRMKDTIRPSDAVDVAYLRARIEAEEADG